MTQGGVVTHRSILAGAMLGVVWGMVLPAVLRCGPVARHVARMEAAGVNPAAMYYTELERLPVRPAWIDRRIVRWP
ncbi:MAG: hypothetical protein ACKONH_05920 [Planctomycetia bacterium]